MEPHNIIQVAGQPDCRRVFLGWDCVVLHAAVDQLQAQFVSRSVWDLRKIVLVLPGGLAARRLNELLAIRAQEQQLVLHPPRIVTIGDLPEQLYAAKRPFAADLVQTLTWMSVLKHTPLPDLQQIIPHPPGATAAQQWLELGKVLANLHRELSSDRLTFADVATALGKNHVESERWRVLQQVQAQYLQQLHELGLWDVQTARLEALRRGEPETNALIVVIGCVDLNRTQRGFLEAVKDHVQIWVAAPERIANLFDAWGCLDGELWQSQTVEIPDDALLVGNSPVDQAELVAASLAELGDSLHARQVTLGVADAELIPELRHHLDLCGISARFGPGKPLVHSEPARLLNLIGDYLDGHSYPALAALVRHPVMENLFRTQRIELPTDWLSQLDDYYQEVLPKTVDSFVNESIKQASVYKQVTGAVNRWLSKLPSDRRQPVSQWIQPLLVVMSTAYDRVQCDPEDPADSHVYDAASQLGAAMIALRDIPTALEPKMTVTELIDWLLRNLSVQLIPEPPSSTAIEMLGWLELVMDDAPTLVVAGIHDGVVPESVSADAFLPNQLRRQLGMLDNTRRYARDLYSLQVLLHSRQRIRLVVGKTDASGDPLTPSRLLLACPLETLPARVLHLVQEENADVLPAVTKRWRPVQGGSNLPIPTPRVTRPPSTITVTAFRDYLACPYRFYLRHVLKLREDHDADTELDAPKFGVLVHGALDRFGQNSSKAASCDAEEIRDYLIQQLHDIALATYGPNPPANILIQVEQAQSRLEAFAIRQAERASQGWQIRFTEQGSTIQTGLKIGRNEELLLIGRIDRIDYHPDLKQWAIWDYKTSENAKHPETVHFKEDRWCDLQLPLYVPIAKTLGVKGQPILGYIGLPKLARDVDFYEAKFDTGQLATAMAVANEVASKVAACEFGEQPTHDVEYDDYARICQTGVTRVLANPPARRLHRTRGGSEQVVSADAVRAAKKLLNSTIVRAPIKLAPLLIRASAGTGKTFQLSNRLLYILLSGQDVDPILATTFTRKAAGEIMQRVLQRLAQGCIHESKRQELEQHLLDVDVSIANCLATLRRVTASIHRLRISTLDSFFAQVARTFSLEMGLPAGWTALDPVREPQVQSQAISDLLDSHDHRTMMDLVRMLAKGESTRKVSDEIRSTVRDGFATFRATQESHWDQLPLVKAPSEAVVESAVLTLEGTKCDHGKIDPQLRKLEQMARTGQWLELIQHGIYKRLDEDSPSYYSRELPANLVVALRILAERAAAELLPICRNQTLASYNVLKAFDSSYAALLRRSRSLAFSDVSYFLSQWMHGGQLSADGARKLSQLEYRMDCGIQHLLLDEFQDTSLEQWDILRPIAQPLGGQPTSDRSFFCVGDTKQAIYGWRGGVAEIFDSVKQSIDGLQTSDLRDSYRSSAEVMEVVNRVFLHLTKHRNYGGCDELAKRWSKQFPEHRTSRDDLSGYVQMINGPKFDKDDPATADEKKLAFLQFSADQIADLANKSSASIGVLLRTNDDVARMVALLRERNISASQGGGNPLTDSAAVELMMSLIHLADHPGDGIAQFHLRSSPLFERLPEEIREDGHALARWFRVQVTRQGLATTVEQVADKLANNLSWWDQQRLEQLIHSARRFEATGGRLRDFEDSVMSDRVALPIEAQVKVLTIHASKGLEYDAVFLPELDIPLTKSSALLITRRPDPCQPPNGVLRYMNASLQAILPNDWQQAFDHHKDSTLFESLCVLYVAMTRARNALYMITHPAGKEHRQDACSLLHSTLAEEGADTKEPMVELYHSGDSLWYRTFPKQVPAASSTMCESELQIQLQQSAALAPMRDVRLQSPSHARVAGEPLFVAHAFSVGETLNAVYGRLIHLLFEQVNWLDRFTLSNQQLEQIATARMSADDLRHLSVPQVIDEFRSLLQLSSVQRILNRSRYGRSILGAIPDSVEIENESEVSAIVDGQMISGTIDRLAVLYKDGRPFAAEIFDYKVDAFDPKMTLLWLEDRVEFHRPQLEAYSQAIAQQLHLPREQVVSHLVMLSTDDLVRVGSAPDHLTVPQPHLARELEPTGGSPDSAARQNGE